jgi:hypothetical protein
MLDGEGIPLDGGPPDGGGRRCWLLQAVRAKAAVASNPIRHIVLVCIAHLLTSFYGSSIEAPQAPILSLVGSKL